MADPTPRQVAAANVALHSRLAETYDKDEPHFRPENLERVNGILTGLKARTSGKALLDLGCGTGFVLNLAKRHFARVVGVDITPAMIRRVDRAGGRVHVGLANVEELPVSAASFDVITANSFFHHLMRLEPTFREAYRVLRPGGILWSELDPNWYFWQAMKDAPEKGAPHEIVVREIDQVLHKDDELGGKSGLTGETIRFAEYIKSIGGGIREEEAVPILRRIGFRDVRFEYHWFLGQAAVMHGQSFERARQIEEYLRTCLPVSRPMFKYVSITAVK